MDIVNFRDLGGIECADERRVLPKRLLRSGELVGVSEADKRTLVDEYDLRCVVDFRTKTERAMHPDDSFADVTPKGASGVSVEYVPINLFSGASENAPAQEILAKLSTPEEVDTFMKSAYTMLIAEESARVGYRHYVEVLLGRKEGATLEHCSAGKDRTGVATAIVLTILGASEEAIMKDFLRTNEMRKLTNVRIVEYLKEQKVSETQLKAMEGALDVKESYLETAYATATKLFGSFRDYIRDGLSIDGNITTELRELYLEK